MILLFTLLGLVVSQCMNNGVRHDMSNDYICECALDWTGKNCDVWTGNLDANQKIGCNFVTIPTDGSDYFNVSPHNVNGASCTVLIGQSKHYTAVVVEALSIELSGAQNPNPNFYFVTGNHHPVLKNNVQATIANNFASFKMSDIPTAAQSDSMVEVVTLVYVEDEHSSQVENYDFAVSFDIDECIEMTDDCHVHATCTNTNTGYTCACDAFHTDVSTGAVGTDCIDSEHKAMFDECDTALGEIMGDKVTGENTLSSSLSVETLRDEVLTEPMPMLGDLITEVETILNDHVAADAETMSSITSEFITLEMADRSNENNMDSTIAELDAKDVEQDGRIATYENQTAELQIRIDAEEVLHEADKVWTQALLDEVNTNLTASLQALRDECVADFELITTLQGEYVTNQSVGYEADKLRLENIDAAFVLDVSAMTNQYAGITTTLNTKSDEINAAIDTMVNTMNSQTGLVDTKFDELQPYIDNWKNTVAGFTYELTADMSCCGNIKFTNKVFQTSPDYNPGTGEFTAPVEGYYYFSYHIKVTDPDQVRVQLIDNQGVVTGEMVIKDNLRVGRDHITMSSVAHVLKGDKVYLKLDSMDIMAGSHFSGFLIQADPMWNLFNEANPFESPMETQTTAPVST